jgi:hypothetical protein
MAIQAAGAWPTTGKVNRKRAPGDVTVSSTQMRWP